MIGSGDDTADVFFEKVHVGIERAHTKTAFNLSVGTTQASLPLKGTLHQTSCNNYYVNNN